MASTSYSDFTGPAVSAAWLNDVNYCAYNILGNGTTIPANAAAARANLGIVDIPSQTGNSGKYLTTNGTAVSWSSINLASSSVSGILPISAGGTNANTASAARTSLGLGTAATFNVGTSANNIVQLDGSSKLPAVDGSQLTNITPAYPTQTGNAGKFLTTNGTTTSWAFPITLGTAVATTSGTAFDFTGLSSTTKRIKIQFMGVSTNGTSPLQVQIGTSGGIQNTGYLGSVGYIQNSSTSVTSSFSSGFLLTNATTAASIVHGSMSIDLLDTSTGSWVASTVLGSSNAAIPLYSAGSKSLSGTLDRIRITTVNGTDTFDAGTINILVE